MRRLSALSFVLLLIVAAGCKSGTAGKVITVTVTPATATVTVGHTQQFTATVTDTSNTAVTWTVMGGNANGMISSTGLYTAPASVPTPAQVTVVATSVKDPTRTGTATVTVTTMSSISVVVSPATANVANFGTQQFGATVTGTSNTAVTWQVNGITGGNQTIGFISANGLFVAPGGVPTVPGGSTTTTTVTAVSQANSSSSGSATVTIVPGNQNTETTPVKLGTSGGNAKDSSTSGGSTTCCGGTLGSLVTLNGVTQYILSNNHVLARSDSGTVASGSTPGDNIIQPGLIDTNCNPTATVVGHLSQFYNLETGNPPKIDAALAQVVTGTVDTTGNILYLGAATDGNNVPLPGAPHGVGVGGFGGVPAPVSPTVGLTVAKSGRSTGLTCSSIGAIKVSATVQYQKGCGTGATFNETFTDEISVMGGSFSAEGDSGSLIVAQNTADPVALLFAGSDTDTVGNPITDVLNFFSNNGTTVVTFGTGPTHQVIGCSLPNTPHSVSQTAPAPSVKPDVLQKAVAVRDAHASELQAHPEVQAVGVGASYDSPGEAAILFFVTKGKPHTDIPAEVDGIRTRIVEAPLFPHRGTVSVEESAANEETTGPVKAVYPISQAEYERAKVVHAAHVKELMAQPGVQGVGIGSSVDSPGEAALMIFLIRGVEHNPIPPVIDGVRTRIRESSRFRAGYGGNELQRSCSLPAKSAR